MISEILLSYAPDKNVVYGPTDKCKAIYPHFFEGGHNKFGGHLENFGVKTLKIQRNKGVRENPDP